MDLWRRGVTGAHLPMGLGARHSAAAAATTETKAVAITVSQTTGTVRFFKGGAETNSVVMRSKSRTIRYITSVHQFEHKPNYG